MIPVYKAEELRLVAKRHPAYSEFWFDAWLARNHQSDDRYTFSHRDSLYCWLIRFANQPVPHKEKV